MNIEVFEDCCCGCCCCWFSSGCGSSAVVFFSTDFFFVADHFYSFGLFGRSFVLVRSLFAWSLFAFLLGSPQQCCLLFLLSSSLLSAEPIRGWWWETFGFQWRIPMTCVWITLFSIWNLVHLFIVTAAAAIRSWCFDAVDWRIILAVSSCCRWCVAFEQQSNEF